MHGEKVERVELSTGQPSHTTRAISPGEMAIILSRPETICDLRIYFDTRLSFVTRSNNIHLLQEILY